MEQRSILFVILLLISTHVIEINSEIHSNKTCTCDVKYTNVGFVSYMRLVPTIKRTYYTYSCLDFRTLFICTAFRVVRIEKYIKVYKKKYFLAVKQVPCCCEGYEEIDSDSCRPQCTDTCQNGGTCTQPDTCSCPQGWTGHDCSTDVNECNSEEPPCQQICENTNGSYSCSCHLGFYKQPDNINRCVRHTARLVTLRVKATDLGHLTVHWMLAASLELKQLLQSLQLNYSYPLNGDMEVISVPISYTQSQVSTTILYPGTPVHFKLSLIYKSDLLQENQPNLTGITQTHFRVPDPNMERCLNYYNLEQFIKNRLSGNSTHTPSPCSEETDCIDQSTAPYYFCQ